MFYRVEGRARIAGGRTGLRACGKVVGQSIILVYGTRFDNHITSRSSEVNQELLPMSERIDLCGAAEVEPGAALKVETGDLTLAVFNVDGEYYVTDDLCTHGPGSLSEGYIEGDVVECNFHNGQFNIKTGEVVLPPCMIPVKTYKTFVEDGRVFIETE
jgi:nitrite reductase/ring-hydroxylating ferredoxin subunit